MLLISAISALKSAFSREIMVGLVVTPATGKNSIHLRIALVSALSIIYCIVVLPFFFPRNMIAPRAQYCNYINIQILVRNSGFFGQNRNIVRRCADNAEIMRE